MRKILHVGFHKTGTTTIQHELNQARSALLAAGVHYPSQTLVGEPAMAGHHRLAQTLFNDPEAGRSMLTEMLAQAGAGDTPVHTILLSAEGFSRFGLKGARGETWRQHRARYVAALAEAVGRDTEIVAVLRRPDSYLLSLYQEVVRTSSQTRTVEQYRNKDLALLAFRAQLEIYQAHFDTVHILIFEDMMAALTERFLAALDVPGFVPLERLRHSNVSLHPYLTEYKRICNHARSDRAENAAIRAALKRLQAQGGPEFLQTRCALMGPEERADYMAGLSDDLDWLGGQLGRGPGAEIFPPVGDEPPKWTPMTLAQFEEIHRRVCALRAKAAAGTP